MHYEPTRWERLARWLTLALILTAAVLAGVSIMRDRGDDLVAAAVLVLALALLIGRLT